MKPQQIWVLADIRFGYARNITRGVLDYAREHPEWAVRLAMEPQDLAAGRGSAAGLIVTAQFRKDFDTASFRGLPLVRAGAPGPGPAVYPDNVQVGRLAAEHFLDNGFTRFAFYSEWFGESVCDRFAGFASRLREAGIHSIQVAPQLLAESGMQSVARKMPPLDLDRPEGDSPLAVFAFNDRQSLSVIRKLQENGVQIPEQVAVLGVDNDELFCDTAFPALSSIDTSAHRIGFTAMETLARVIQGKRVQPHILIPPVAGVTRQSTDILAVPDKAVATALRRIRHSFQTELDVRSMAREAGVNRRTLEKRFLRLIGRAPYAEVTRIRMEHACNLLIRSGLSTEQIAEACGYATVAHFHVAFKKFTGFTPGTFRQQHSRGTSGGITSTNAVAAPP